MARANKRAYLVAMAFVLATLPGLAQSDSLALKHGQNYRIYLNNGETLTGFVVDESFDFVTIEKRPQLSHTQVRRNTIVKAEPISIRESFKEDALGENPHAGAYLFSSSVLPYDPETISSTAHWFIFDNVQYAFSENFAIYASSITFYPFGLGLKCSFRLDDLNYIGANASGFMQVGGSDLGSDLMGYIAQAKLTHGTTNRNFTFGAGYLGFNPEIFGAYQVNKLLFSTPVLSAAFCNRFASRWAVVLDGHFLPDESVMLGGIGLKFLRDEYTCWTFGCYSFVNDLGSNSFFNLRSFSFPLPYFSYCRKFQ